MARFSLTIEPMPQQRVRGILLFVAKNLVPGALTLKFYTLCRSGDYYQYPIYLFKNVARRASKKWTDKCEWGKNQFLFLEGQIQNCKDGKNS
jgi:hypothetical protein